MYHAVDDLKLEEILHSQEVLWDELGMVKMPAVSLKVKDSSQLKFVHAYPVPFAIKDAIGREFDRLEEIGMLRVWSFVVG